MAVRIRDRLTYANVMATIAVFGVLAGGGAYAASKIRGEDIARHAVGTAKLKPEAVTKGKVAKGALTTSHIKNGSLLAGDFADGELSGIVARVRGNDHVETKHHGTPYPLNDATWTQKAGALNMIYGRVAIDEPADCVGPSTPGDGVGVEVFVDGSPVGASSGGTFGPILLWEPSEDVEHTMTASADDACEPGRNVHGTVTMVEADVVEVR